LTLRFLPEATAVTSVSVATPYTGHLTRSPDPQQGPRNAKYLAAQLDKSYPGGAAPLREGLDEISSWIATKIHADRDTLAQQGRKE
jgi:hypothetical protein